MATILTLPGHWHRELARERQEIDIQLQEIDLQLAELGARRLLLTRQLELELVRAAGTKVET